MKKGIVGVGLAVALTGVVAAPAIVPVTAAYAEDVTTVSTAEGLAAAVANGGSIKLGADITASITVPAGKTVTLDLGGKTLTNVAGKHTITVAAGGSLTVKGTGTVDNVSHACGAVYNNPGATVVLSGGTYTRSKEAGSSATESGKNSWYTLFNRGSMTINDGVTVNQGPDGKGQFSSLIENGYYTGSDYTKSYSQYDTPTLTISGGTFFGGINTVKNDDWGSLTINGGDFRSIAQAAVLNWNKTTINGGTFVSQQYGVLNAATGKTGMDDGDLKIAGGTFEAPTLLAEKSGSDHGQTAAVTGGTFTGSFTAAGTSISGGKFSNLNTLVSAATYLSDGMAVETSDGETFTVKTAADAEKGSSYVISASLKGDDDTKLNIYFSGDDAQKNAEEFIGGDDSGESPFEPIKKDDIKTLNYYVNVHYDANGGGKLDTTYFTFTADEVKDDTLHVNSKEFATATREGYNFAGWYLYDPEDPTKAAEPLTKYLNDKGELEIELDEDDFQTSDNEWDVYLRASWTYATYTVKFDSNGGSEVKDVTLDVDDEGLATLKEADLPKNPTREGYKFVGWQEKDEDGTYDLVEYPDHFTAGETAEESTTTLKASWITDHVVVNFDSNGGTAVDSVVLKTNDQNFATFSKNDLPKNPTREGYTFAGWQIYAMVDEDGTLAWVDADLTETQFGAAETEEGATFTVRASWTRNDESASKKDNEANKKDNESSKKALPKTGDASLVATVAAGLAGLSAAGAGLVTKRRNK